jgi:hypothetical protein
MGLLLEPLFLQIAESTERSILDGADLPGKRIAVVCPVVGVRNGAISAEGSGLLRAIRLRLARAGASFEFLDDVASRQRIREADLVLVMIGSESRSESDLLRIRERIEWLNRNVVTVLMDKHLSALPNRF